MSLSTARRAALAVLSVSALAAAGTALATTPVASADLATCHGKAVTLVVQVPGSHTGTPGDAAARAVTRRTAGPAATAAPPSAASPTEAPMRGQASSG